MTIDRRTSLLVLSGAVFADMKMAFGQTSVKYLYGDISSAQDLQRSVVDMPLDGVDQFAPKFVIEGFNLRRKSVADAAGSGVFTDVNKAVTDLNSSVGYNIGSGYILTEDRINSQIAVINFVASQGIQLLPDARDILPIGIPVADPLKQKNSDSDFSVILDIALQTMGIVEDKEKLIDEAMKDSDVQAFLQSAVPAIQSGDWQKLVELGERIFNLIIAAQFFRNYAEKIGRRVAFRLGLRCVPLLGWIFVAAAFIMALKANYHRFSFA
jgi:hypothetical protein